jgi:hypothetical protein
MPPLNALKCEAKKSEFDSLYPETNRNSGHNISVAQEPTQMFTVARTRSPCRRYLGAGANRAGDHHALLKKAAPKRLRKRNWTQSRAGVRR